MSALLVLETRISRIIIFVLINFIHLSEKINYFILFIIIILVISSKRKKLSNILKQKLHTEDGGYIYIGTAYYKLLVEKETELNSLKVWAEENCTLLLHYYKLSLPGIS